MIGIHVAAYPHLAAAVAQAGHAIANHTWTHAWLTGMPASAVSDELALASAIHAACRRARAPVPRARRGLVGGSDHAVRADADGPAGLVGRPARQGPARSAQHRRHHHGQHPARIDHLRARPRQPFWTVAALRIVLPRLRHQGYHFQAPLPLPPTTAAVHLLKCGCRGQTELMRVVVTRIDRDGTVRRRVVDTAAHSHAGPWEELSPPSAAHRPSGARSTCPRRRPGCPGRRA